jgi:glycosyltransferase involved in cell wall biosynthesis
VRPVLLQVATLVEEERKSQFRRRRDPWRRFMTRITSRRDMEGLASVRLAFVENLWMQEKASSLLGPSRVILAPPGIDTELFRPAAGYRADGPILSVGRLSDPRKNVRLLIEAYAALRRADPGAPRLVLAGSSGPPEEDLSLARELGVEGSIDVRIGLSRETLAALYRDASLFVLSSDEEGLGLVVLEAMASGLPILATRCGGSEISVSHGVNGLLVPVRDAAAMTAGLRELLADAPARRRMGEESRRRAEASFSTAAAGRHFLEAYASILAEHR